MNKSPEKQYNSFIFYFSVILKGICMGSADIIPGVSGGTIAFITGIYENLINSIKSINKKTIKLLLTCKFRQCFHLIQWKFLLSLTSGILIAFVSLAHFFSYLLNHHIYYSYLYAIFFGLIIGSIIFCIKQVPKWNLLYLIVFFFGIVTTFVLTSPSKIQLKKQLYDIDISNDLKTVSQLTLKSLIAKNVITKETLIYSHAHNRYGPVKEFIKNSFPFYINGWFIICGAIAASAMLLPGISGSYLLNILGVYNPILTALAEFLSSIKQADIDLYALSILVSTLLGIIIGLMIFSRIISYLFQICKHIIISLLTGFMLGAIHIVWPFWSYVHHTDPISHKNKLTLVNPIIPSHSTNLWIVITLVLISLTTVIIIEKKHRSRGI